MSAPLASRLSNYCEVTLVNGIDSSQTTARVDDPNSNLLTPPFPLEIYNSTDYASPFLDSNREILWVDSKVLFSGTQWDLTIRRGAEDSTASAHNTGGKTYKLRQGMTRDLFANNAPRVNVRDFGAVGDASTDDRAAIQAAIDSLPAVGGTVLFPEGRYLVGSPGLSSTKIGVILEGVSPGSSKYHTPCAAIYGSASGVTLLTIGDTTSTISGGWVVRNLSFKDVSTGGDQLTGAIHVRRLSNCSFENVHVSPMHAGCAWHFDGTTGSFSQRHHLFHCNAEDVKYGIKVTDSVADIVVLGGHFVGDESSGSVGIECGGTTRIHGTECHEFEINFVMRNNSNALIDVRGHGTGSSPIRHVDIQSGDDNAVIGCNFGNTAPSSEYVRIQSGSERTKIIALGSNTSASGRIADSGTDTLILDANENSVFPTSAIIKGPDPWIDVKAYGAKGDGTTDDTTAIQDAIDDATGNDGDNSWVFMPKGTYLITSTIDIKEKVLLIGAGSTGVIIKMDSSFSDSPMAAVRIGDGTGITHGAGIENIKIDCNTVSGSIGIYSTEAQERSCVKNCIVTQYMTYGIHYSGDNCKNTEIEQMQIIADSSATTPTGIYLDNIGARVRVKDVSFSASGAGSSTNAILFTSGEAHFEDIHPEDFEVGINFGSGANGSAKDVTGHPSVTDTIKISSGAGMVLCLNIGHLGGTNSINDVVNSKTLTDGTVGLYIGGDATSDNAWIMGDMVVGQTLTIGVYTNGTRPLAGTAGRIIFNQTDGQLNIDDGSNWTLPDGSTT